MNTIRRSFVIASTSRLAFVLLCLLSHCICHVAAFSMRMDAAAANNNKNKVNVIAGATGYIGKSVVRESVRQGFHTVALVRDLNKIQSSEGKALYGEFFAGAQVVECDVCKPDQLVEVSELEENL